MATGGDNACLPLNIIINILKRLLVESLAVVFSPSGKQMATESDNPYLPKEIIINILKRLPVKSLVRFRSVCKDWRNLLKSPSFIAEHYHHSAHNNPLLICYASTPNHRYSPLCLLRYKMESVEVERMPAMDSLRRVRAILASSNGLLCLILGSNDDLLLLNPATREVRQVPRSTNDDGRYCIFGRGFGFSPVVGDYKIVRIHVADFNFDNNCVDGAEVYSVRTGSWKEVEFGVIRSVRFQSGPATVNGAIFWLGLDTEDMMIVSFDLTIEVFTLIPIPSSISFAPPDLSVLYVYENKLALLHGHRADKSYFIDLWVLEEDSGTGAYGKSWGWTKKYSIGPTSPSLFPKCFWRNEIVCQWSSDFELEDDAAFLFNLTTSNELNEFHISLSGDRVGRISNYVESLVPMWDAHVE